MVPLQVIGQLLLSLAGFICSYLIFLGLTTVLARRKFTKQSPNIPHAPNGSLFSGHNGLFVLQKYNIKTLDSYHKKLGKTIALFRHDRPCVSTTDIDLLKEIHLDEPNDHLNRPFYRFPMNEVEVDSIATAPHHQWLRIRRAVAPAISGFRMKSSNVQEETEQAVHLLVNSIMFRLDSVQKKCLEINLDDVITRYTMNFVLTNFYKRPNIITFNTHKDHWCELLHDLLKFALHPLLGFMLNFPITHPFVNFFASRLSRHRLFRRAIRTFTIDAAKLHSEARKQAELENTQVKGFDFTKLQEFVLTDGSKFKRNTLDYIIDHLHTGKLRYNEYINSVCFLYYASERTLTEVIVRILYYLSIHNHVQSKLRQSLLTDGIKSEYLNWVIKESIRLFPPVPHGSSRVVTRDFYTKEGFLIPKGCSVYSATYTIHRMKEYWGEDAEEFRPERWANEKDFRPCQFSGFGSGKRGCPGKEMAFIQLSHVINALVTHFNFEKSNKPDRFTEFTAPMMVFVCSSTPIYARVSIL